MHCQEVCKIQNNSFDSNSKTTIGTDFISKKILVEGKLRNLQIWTPSGGARFKKVAISVCKGAHGLVFVYDITNFESFHDLKNWMEEVESSVPPSLPKIIVGNKCDLFRLRAVEETYAQKFADDLGVRNIETSAKEGKNIDEIFVTLATQIVETAPLLDRPSSPTPSGVFFSKFFNKSVSS